LLNANQEIKELQDFLHELGNWVVDLHKQLDMKDKLIEALYLKLIEKEQKMLTMQMVDAICDTNDLIQTIDVTCDTNGLMVDTDATNDMIDDP